MTSATLQARPKPATARVRRKTRWLRWRLRAENLFNFICALAAVNLLAGNFGAMSWTWLRAGAGLCLLASVVFNLRWPLRVRSPALAWGAAAAAFGFLFLLLHADQFNVSLFLAGVYLWAAGRFVAAVGGRWRRNTLLVMCMGAYALVKWVADATPFLADWAFALCRVWTHFIGQTFLHQPLEISSSGMGGGTLASVFCFVAVAWLRSPRKKHRQWSKLGDLTALFALSSVVYLWLQNDPRFVAQADGPIFHSQILMLGFAALLLGVAGMRARAAVPGWPRGGLAAVCFLTLTGAVFALTLWPVNSSHANHSILFRDDGFLDWKRPVYGHYGAYESGMFGSLPDYLESIGFKCDFAQTVTAPRAATAGVVMIINPTNQWSPAELDTLWQFVGRGGSLLVIGDHTDIMGSRNSLNTLLAPVHVGFNFDAGFFARPEWLDCLSFLPHPITARVSTAADAEISVGATLDIAWPAFAVVRGRYGFADLGNILNVQGAFLGNYRYEKGEQLGDVVLVAAAYYGKGKVLIFGDTSSFQNGALAFSFERFVQPLMVWLTARDGSWIIFGKWALAALALAAGCVWAGCAGGNATALLLLAMALACALGTGQVRRQTPEPTLNAPVAWIDRAHANRISLVPLQADSIGPLTVSLLRNHLLPIVKDAWEPGELAKANALLVTAPARAFSGKELSALEEFVHGGGLLLINCGWEEKGAAATALLRRFGFDIPRVPLGPYPVVRAQNHLTGQAQFISAWPVMLTDTNLQVAFADARAAYRAPILDAAQSAKLAGLLSPLLGQPSSEGQPAPAPAVVTGTNSVQVLFQTADGYPVIVARRLGAGSVVVIGDTLFFGNDNLENLQYYRQGNILFLKHLFDTVAWRRTK